MSSSGDLVTVGAVLASVRRGAARAVGSRGGLGALMSAGRRLNCPAGCLVVLAKVLLAPAGVLKPSSGTVGAWGAGWVISGFAAMMGLVGDWAAGGALGAVSATKTGFGAGLAAGAKMGVGRGLGVWTSLGVFSAWGAVWTGAEGCAAA